MREFTKDDLLRFGELVVLDVLKADKKYISDHVLESIHKKLQVIIEKEF